jgi:flavin reductase ActVB
VTATGAAGIVEHDGECGLVLHLVRGRDDAVLEGAAAAAHADGGLDAVVAAAPFWSGPLWPGPPGGTSAAAPGGTGTAAPGGRRPAAGPPPDRAGLPDRAGPAAFREAMSRFASGVTVVTTRDGNGRPYGLTVSAFCSLSASPPLVLVCIDRAARCHDAFMEAGMFAVSVLRPHHQRLALRFASRETDKFGSGQFETDERGLPQLPGALASLTCRAEKRVPAGDHTILIGRVISAISGEGEPLLFFRRGFRRLRRTGPA